MRVTCNPFQARSTLQGVMLPLHCGCLAHKADHNTQKFRALRQCKTVALMAKRTVDSLPNHRLHTMMLNSKIIVLVLTVCRLAYSGNLRADVSGRLSKEEDTLPRHPDPEIGSKLLQQIRLLTSNSAKMDGITHGKLFSTGKTGQDGFWMSQSRSSADCSGDVVSETGTRMGACHTDGHSGSHYMSCEVSDDGKVAQYRHAYATTDCSGDRHSVASTVEFDTCRFVPQYVPYYGFTKQQTSCSKGLSAFTTAKPGILLSYYSDAHCSKDAIQYFSRIPFETCRMFVSGGDEVGVLDSTSSFGYVKLSGCGSSGQVNVRFFSDAQCTKATYVGEMDLRRDPLFNQCQLDTSVGGDGMWGTAVCQS